MSAPDYPFVALHDLNVAGIRAFARGDGIPGEHPQKFDWVLGEDYAEAGSDAAVEVNEGPQRPAKSAPKGDWVDYVVTLQDAGELAGLPRDVAEGKTKDELMAHVDEHVG